MEAWLIGVLAVLALAVLVLGLRFLALRRAFREVADGLEEKLNTDTNTLIGISSGTERFAHWRHSAEKMPSPTCRIICARR